MTANALAQIKAKSEPNGAYPVVPFFVCREVAREHGLSFLEAELLALQNGICPSRYERNVGTIGLAGQEKLLRTSVAVAGCGGLGGWIIEMLARLGFGRIAMADGDTFSDSNLNRQVFSTEENIGVLKAEAAARRVAQVNAAIGVRTETNDLDAGNVRGFLNGCDLFFDALDSNRARSIVFDACADLDIPFIHGAIGGWFGQTAIFQPGDVPLWTKPDTPDRGIETRMGNPAFMPALIAAMQVAQGVGIVTGVPENECRELLWFDLLHMGLQKIKL